MKGVIARFPKKGAEYKPAGRRADKRRRRAEKTRDRSATSIASQTATECANGRNRGSKRNDASEGCSADAPVPIHFGNSSGDGDGWRRSPQLATDSEDTSCDDVAIDGGGGI